MKRMCSIICLLAVCLLTGCASADAQEQDPVFTTETAATTVFETHPETTIAESTKLPETETVITTTVTEIMTTSPMTEPVTEAVSAEPQLVYETFSGILIDADCADFDDPPAHDLPCMLMDTCRASGYGLDVQQADGTWIFIPFDENGQNLAWEYLLHTTRMDNLYVEVTGTLTDGIIAVQTLTEIE